MSFRQCADVLLSALNGYGKILSALPRKVCYNIIDDL